MFVQRPNIRAHHHNHNHHHHHQHQQHTSSTASQKPSACGSVHKRTKCSATNLLKGLEDGQSKRESYSPKVLAVNERKISNLNQEKSTSIRQTNSNVETHTSSQITQNIVKVPCEALSNLSSFRSHENKGQTKRNASSRLKTIHLRRSKSLTGLQNKPKPTLSTSCDCILITLLRKHSKKNRQLVEQEGKSTDQNDSFIYDRKSFSSFDVNRSRTNFLRKGKSFDAVVENISSGVLDRARRLWSLVYFWHDFFAYQLETWRLLAEDDNQRLHRSLFRNLDNSSRTILKELVYDLEFQTTKEKNSQALEYFLGEQMNTGSTLDLNDPVYGGIQTTMFDHYNSSDNQRYYQSAQPFQSVARQRHLPHSSFSHNHSSHDTTEHHHISQAASIENPKTSLHSGLLEHSRLENKRREGNQRSDRINTAFTSHHHIMNDAHYVREARPPVSQHFPFLASACKKQNNGAQQVASGQMLINPHSSVADSLDFGPEEPRSLSLNDSEDPYNWQRHQHRAILQAQFHTQQSVDGLMHSYSKSRPTPLHRPISSIGQYETKLDGYSYQVQQTAPNFGKTSKVGSDSELYSSNHLLENPCNSSHLKMPFLASRPHNQMSSESPGKVNGHSESPSVSARSMTSDSSRPKTSNGRKNNSIKLSLSGAKKRLGFKQNGLNTLSVQRSEEVIPFDTNLSFSDSFIESSLINQLHWQATSETLSTSFVEGLGPGQVASRQALVSPYLGDIQLTLSDRRGMLEVEVVRARRLQAKLDAKSLPSPYVKVYLVKNKKCIAKFKTAQARQTLDPLYQQLFIFREDYAHCVVQVIIWGDYGKKDRKSLMGIVQISIDELDISNLVIGWYKLLNAPSMINSLHSSKALRQMMLAKQT